MDYFVSCMLTYTFISFLCILTSQDSLFSFVKNLR
ncbi:unnamed protein product [Brassica rapa subsp. narinosa]